MRRLALMVSVTALVATMAGPASAGPDPSAPAAAKRTCISGAHTLSPPGAHVYPEMGNAGYLNIRTSVHLVYDAPSNRFLRGNHVRLQIKAQHCLNDFSLDLERHSPDKVNGPDLRVRAVTVDGKPATWRFEQPTYPGDPNGQNDPDPRAHEASQNNPVGGPGDNPLPPACTPEVTGGDVDGQDGQQCPKNKLVITPKHPIARGRTVVVKVAYTGRPGTHIDGDGSTEGWFRSKHPKGDGGFVTTEPVGTEDWMPLNNYPTAKPFYDFAETVNKSRTAIANGRLGAVRTHRPDKQFPHGSRTFHWRTNQGVASYLVESSVGHYDLTSRKGSDGIRYYMAQASSLSPARKRANLRVMRQQQRITDFQATFNGPFPFPSDGVVIGTPPASFEEEMQSMITFAGGRIDLDTFNHENMHQWWGDHVTEGGFSMTFFKEGMATVGEYLFHARRARAQAGGPGTPAGRAAFQRSLVKSFNRAYASTGEIWTGAPSDPTPATLFDGGTTYTRPGAAYLALRQILGHQRFVKALHFVQRQYGFISEPQLEAAFAHYLPTDSTGCQTRLADFFTQWFDTAYPSGSEPTLTGPGLHGEGFYDHGHTCL
ncbi:MAG TPA: M1 family aminopeptidase [Nocardioides sp.]|uniref:M1 family aminopeptidase n=1 Tax=Nocardioides sp. TaxID=35761 RepID=UPI002E345EBA|nr:M1 family aminopeptidase [Nocardioides sp.]HEX3929955.1 M1 family aminopeptidase [Nocardioides sp.]